MGSSSSIIKYNLSLNQNNQNNQNNLEITTERTIINTNTTNTNTNTNTNFKINYLTNYLNYYQKTQESNMLNEIVILLMPTYYISKQVTKRDVKICQSSWNIILGNKSIEFNRKQKENLDFSEKYHGKCLNWFTDIFYERFFDVHPISRSLFANKDMEYLKSQIVKVISLTLSQTKDNRKFIKLMKDIATKHNERGIQAIEYGIMGNVLFYALNKCLGDEQYMITTDIAWKTIYSSMLRYIVPECVKYHHEQSKKDEQYEQYFRNHSFDYNKFHKSSSINSRHSSINENNSCNYNNSLNQSHSRSNSFLQNYGTSSFSFHYNHHNNLSNDSNVSNIIRQIQQQHNHQNNNEDQTNIVAFYSPTNSGTTNQSLIPINESEFVPELKPILSSETNVIDEGILMKQGL